MAKPFKITNATLYWCSTAQPNPMSEKYQVDLCQLTEKQVKRLTEMGLTVHNKGDDRGFYVTAKSKHPVTVIDMDDALIRDNSVGNGSKGDAVCVTYPFTVGKGTGLGINKLKVTDLNEFVSDGVDMDDVEEL